MTLRRPLISAAAPLAALLAAAAPTSGQAHPHVWVTGAATVHLDGAKIGRIGMRWQFDAFFSQVLMGDFDKNQDGAFDAEETAAMENQVFTSLRDYGYFTHLRVDGGEVLFDRVENFVATVDNGELIYAFDLVPGSPIDAAAAPVQLSVYDPTVYVDIILGGETPVKLEGSNAAKCGFSFGDGDAITAQDGGYILPQIVTLTCGA